MRQYPMITIEEERDYLADKPKFYRLGWVDCRDNRPIRKFTLHNKKDAAESEMYHIGYGDYIANIESVGSYKSLDY
tara:strand:- start:535 stop:762 length:228 start_codon:yes stop_codon:yes gene_type:complete